MFDVLDSGLGSCTVDLDTILEFKDNGIYGKEADSGTEVAHGAARPEAERSHGRAPRPGAVELASQG
jgi:hypothetical protein